MAKIRLVDFDYVTLSSLNRHAAAGLADVGTPKVKCLENALRKFSRWIEIDLRIELWKKEDGSALLEGVDWVVGMSFRCVAPPQPSQSGPTADAIGNVDAKVDLLYYCHTHNIKVGHWWSSVCVRTLTLVLRDTGFLFHGCRSKIRSIPSTNQRHLIHCLRSTGAIRAKALEIAWGSIRDSRSLLH